MNEVSALYFDFCRTAMPNDGIWSAVDSGTILGGPGEPYAVITRQRMHVFANLDLGHANFDKVKRFLVNVLGNLDGFADPFEFGGGLPAA